MIEQTLVFKTFRMVVACSLMELNIHSVFVDFDIANILLLIHIDQDEGKHVSVGQRVLWLDFFYFSTIAQNCTTLCRFICPLLRVNYHSVHLKFEPKSNINIFFGTCYQAFIPGYPVIRMFGKLIANYSAKRQQAMRKQTPLWRQNKMKATRHTTVPVSSGYVQSYDAFNQMYQ